MNNVNVNYHSGIISHKHTRRSAYSRKRSVPPFNIDESSLTKAAAAYSGSGCPCLARRDSGIRPAGRRSPSPPAGDTFETLKASILSVSGAA